MVEGLDGAGTTTQVTRIATWLRAAGHDVLQTREPTEGPVGRVIRDVLAGRDGAPTMETLPWLFAADRADHLFREVEPALARGTHVISDRYYHSSLAYQALTLPLERVHALNEDFRVPDLTVFVDVSVSVCLGRIASRADNEGMAREIFERADFMERVHASYQHVLDWLRRDGEPIVVVDGEAPVAEVEHAIQQHARTLLG